MSLNSYVLTSLMEYHLAAAIAEKDHMNLEVLSKYVWLYFIHFCICLLNTLSEYLRDLTDSGIKPGSPALQSGTLPSEPLGKPQVNIYYMSNLW